MTENHWNRRQALSGIVGAAVWAGLSPRTPAAGMPFNFLVVGDWGRDGSNHQRDVAAQMGKTAASLASACVVSVGDNFYDDGVASVGDRQWRTSFEDIYTAASLQIPWYVVLGNHDYRGTPQAQIDYSATSSRWRMPSRYYSVSGASLGAPHLDLFFIDTSPLVHKYREKVDGKIAANVAAQDVTAQLRWLDATLGASSARWKLVIGHHTLRSGGSAHGETPEIVAAIDPLLHKHGVQAYINGHDHDLQHIRRGGVSYIGSGAGSEVRPVKAVEGTLFCAERSGFASLTSTPDALKLEFRDFGGASLYQATIGPA
jgi:acid phosphatase